MRQARRPDQKDVVCKTASQVGTELEVLRLPRLAPGLSCCLQGRWRQGRGAKSRRRNALGQELRCCLQDAAGAVCGRGPVVGGGSVPSQQGGFAGTGSNNRDAAVATCGRYRGRPLDIRDRRPALRGDTRTAAGAGTRPSCKLPDAAGTGTAGTRSGNIGSAAGAYRRCRTTQFPVSTTPSDLEASVEWVPRPRQWAFPATTFPGELRSFQTGDDSPASRRHAAVDLCTGPLPDHRPRGAHRASPEDGTSS